MIYKTLDNIPKKASKLVYGTPSSAFNGDIAKSYDDYSLAYEMGFRIFDTAHSYDEGEKMLGNWLAKSGHRDDVIILDKGCNPNNVYSVADDFSAKTISKQIDESLERLQTDFVELYILHRDDPSKPVDEIVEILNEYHAKGKIKRFGGSNWTMDRLKQANAYAAAHDMVGFTICSPHFTYPKLARDPWGGSVTITGDANKPYRDYLQELNIPVFNYSSLARGFMSGKYKSDNRIPIEQCIGEGPIKEYYVPENVKRLARAEKVAEELGKTVPQIAIAWLMKQPLNLFPILVPTGERHIQETIDAIHIDLSDAHLAFLDKDE